MQRNVNEFYTIQVNYAAINNFTSSTRKSSCVNARGIPTAAYQVLHLLPEMGYPPWQEYPPDQVWVPPPSPLAGVPPLPARSAGGGGTRGGAPPCPPPARSDGRGTWAGPGFGTPPPPSGPGQGTTPPTGVYRLKILPSLILRMRSVNMFQPCDTLSRLHTMDSSDSPLVQHLLTSWRPSLFDPHTSSIYLRGRARSGGVQAHFTKCKNMADKKEGITTASYMCYACF